MFCSSHHVEGNKTTRVLKKLSMQWEAPLLFCANNKLRPIDCVKVRLDMLILGDEKWSISLTNIPFMQIFLTCSNYTWMLRYKQCEAKVLIVVDSFVQELDSNAKCLLVFSNKVTTIKSYSMITFTITMLTQNNRYTFSWTNLNIGLFWYSTFLNQNNSRTY